MRWDAGVRANGDAKEFTMANRRRRRVMQVCGFGLGLLGAQACRISGFVEEHCENQDGDAYCERKHGGELRYCASGRCEFEADDGCVAARPATNACYAACGDMQTVEDDPSCEGVAEGSSSSATAGTADVTVEPTGDPSTVGTGSMSMSGSESDTETETAETNSTGGGCMDSSECADPKSPVCVESVCVACTEAGFPDQACEAKDAAAPVCRGDGECVACTPTNPSACDGTTPVCDEATSACVGCSFHEQCPESACRIATGGCFDAGNVHDVGQGMEYEEIGDAVADLGQGGEVVLRIFDGASYDEAVTISGAGTAYALLADDGAMVPQWVNTGGGAATLRVQGGAEVYVQSVRLTANTASGFPGVSVSAATLYLDRTEVLGNTGGGLLLTGAASGFVRNCLLGGGPASDNPAVSVDNAAVAILYSTLVGYDDGFGAGAALRCSNPDSVEARNSLFVKTGSGADLDCPELAATYSATENALAGVGNVALGSVMANWFVGITTDLHLNSPPAALLSAAEWRVGDPPVDIDGEPRPAEDATPDVAGADLP
jgi:hypothetical protein